MKFINHLMFRHILIIWLFATSVAPWSHSQEEKLTAGFAYDRGVQAIKSGNFDEGLKAVNDAIANYGKNAKREYGPVFGHFYYLKGILHIKKKEYSEAKEAFKVCFETYKNDLLQTTDKGGGKLPNNYRVLALAQWGGCELLLKNYDSAAQLYEEALELDLIIKSEPRLNRFETMVNLAKSYLNSGKTEKGKKFITDNLEREDLPETIKSGLFMILATDWSPNAPFPEVRNVLEQYGNLIRTEDLTTRYLKHDKRLLNLAATSIQDGELMRGLAWYSMIAPPSEVARGYENRIAELKSREVPENRKAEADQQIGELEAELPKLREQLASMFLGISAAHYQLGSLSGSRGAYKELADHFPDHEQRPTILHNLVVSDVNLGFWKEAYRYGRIFFEEFPDHELKPAVTRVLVEVLFIEGDYEEAYTVASEVREEMQLGSKIRDIPDFVAAASLYHLDRFEEAEVELQSYLDHYPAGQRLEPIEFYIGACKTNLFKWTEAAPLLDGFATKYPESELRPSCLYLSSLTHLVIENYNDCLAQVVELQTKYRNAVEIPASYNVKGDALAGLEVSYEEVNEAYLRAKKLVEEDGRGTADVAAYALRQLITGAVAETQFEEAGAYFSEFEDTYNESAWMTDASIAAIPALVKLDRRDEARSFLEGFINDLSQQPGSAQFDEMFGSYADFMTDNYEITEVRNAYHNFPSITSPPPTAVQAWLLMAEIEALEAVDGKKYKDDIKQVFYALNAIQEKHGSSMSNYTLVRLARWNMKVRGRVDDARRVYNFILNERPQGEALGFALIDLGKMEAKSSQKAQRGEALIKFERVLAELDTPSLREEAILGIARIYTANKDWPKATEAWQQYLDDRTHRMARAEGNYRFAEANQELGRTKEALKLYVDVYANFAGHLDWSTPAYLNAAKILQDDDRLLDSLKVLQDMLKRMGHLDHENIEEGRKLFAEIREIYAASLK